AVLSYRSILHIHLLSFHLHFSFSCASDLLHLHSFPTRRSSDLVLRHYGFTPIYTKPHKADLISTGSILERISEDYQGIVLGSGRSEEHTSNSSHVKISYAVFCLKKKIKIKYNFIIFLALTKFNF